MFLLYYLQVQGTNQISTLKLVVLQQFQSNGVSKLPYRRAEKKIMCTITL